jgi:hypothetical protein
MAMVDPGRASMNGGEREWRVGGWEREDLGSALVPTAIGSGEGDLGSTGSRLGSRGVSSLLVCP